MAKHPPSTRFSPTFWTQRWIPVILAILALALIATVVIVLLAMLGLMPGA
ncbi:MAG: hypothetical protein M1281_08740 [Chloroflexi bacterium]|nr:hypothetical protein [Chloroflexota bacterium]